MNETRNVKLMGLSRNLRRNMTDEENKLWYQFLKDVPIQFYRQKVVGDYILDFYCPSKRVAIELDGNQHYTDEMLESDKKRTRYLNSKRIKVIRYDNADVKKKFNVVCNDIMDKLGLKFK